MVRKLIPKSDSWVSRIGAWWAVFGSGGALSTIMASAVAAVEPIAQYGRAAVGLAGVVLACFIMIAASALTVGWRYLYPLPTDNANRENYLDPVPRSLLQEMDTALTEQINHLRGQLESSNQNIESLARSIASSYLSQDEHHDLLKETLSTFSDRISKIESMLCPHEKGLLAHSYLVGTDGTRLGMIEAKLEELRTSTAKKLDAVESDLDAQRNSHRQLHDKTWQTFRAKQILERVVALMDKLDGVGEVLSAPTADKDVTIDWSEWDRQFKTWVVSLHDLCVLIKPYLDVEASLLDTPSEKYKSQYWSMSFANSRFPNPDQVHDYKTFRILYANLKEHKRGIMDALRKHAFV